MNIKLLSSVLLTAILVGCAGTPTDTEQEEEKPDMFSVGTLGNSSGECYETVRTPYGRVRQPSKNCPKSRKK